LPPIRGDHPGKVLPGYWVFTKPTQILN
jgi:hypothetical protein